MSPQLVSGNGQMQFAAGHVLCGLESQIDALREAGTYFYQRGWSVGTSSNYSVVLGRDPLELLVTASGKDKGRLERRDFVRVDASGCPMSDDQPKSSAETLLHVAAASQDGVGAVLHTHSIWGTLLSDLYFADGGLEIEGYEMLKGLAGIGSHEQRIRVEIVENSQDIRQLAAHVRARFADPHQPMKYGFLIRRHGLYTWGHDLQEARRHIEIFEFLFECLGRRLTLSREAAAAAIV